MTFQKTKLSFALLSLTAFHVAASSEGNSSAVNDYSPYATTTQATNV
jgi:hypothetical protein